MERNEWRGEWIGIDSYSASQVLEFCRMIVPITICISYSRDDHEQYNILELKENLKKFKEIREVYISEDKKIPECQLLLFIATENFIKSKECLHELGLALSNYKEIIPIIGVDINDFDSLNQIDLSQEGFKSHDLGEKWGFKFDGKNVEKFCNELYNYIVRYKRKINLFEIKEEKKIDDQIKNISSIINKFIETEKFREKLEENQVQFEKAFMKLEKKKISIRKFISRCNQILNKK